jgi:hypothetical protein
VYTPVANTFPSTTTLSGVKVTTFATPDTDTVILPLAGIILMLLVPLDKLVAVVAIALMLVKPAPLPTNTPVVVMFPKAVTGPRESMPPMPA